jgi:microcystin degradation protein MlrC
MAASHKTIEEVLKIVKSHVDSDTLAKIMDDLMNVEGNTSFKETIRRLQSKTRQRDMLPGLAHSEKETS